MKRSNLMFLILGLSIIFFGCSKDDFMAPDIDQNDQGEVSLKSLKNEKTPFSGTCVIVNLGDPGTTTVLPNGKTLIKGQTAEWYDEADDARVTGQTFWYINWLMEEEPNTAKLWGKSELFVKNGGGKWEISWHGYQTPTPDGFIIVCDAVGTGKEGEVKGLVAKWTYIMDFEQFVYNFTGSYH